MKKFTELRLEEFDYQLPPELIAYYPAAERDASRMMVLDRKSGCCEIRKFTEISDYLNSGDCLVRNNSKVIKARLYAAPPSNPEKKTEFFLVQSFDAEKKVWTVLSKPRKNVRKFKEFIVLAPERKKLPALKITVVSLEPEVKIEFSSEESEVQGLIDAYGHIPLPPYIKRTDESSDQERYQTVYAKVDGSVAAPTAGLHFTDEILNKISGKGVSIADITLHVGIGTFSPMRTEKISEHKMHSEHFSISASEADKMNFAREHGGRILAVGTTSLRAIESSFSPDGKILIGAGETDLFIYPGIKVKSADMLFTNFHLPKSSLLMLVCAFAGTENVRNAYRLAVQEKFRFFSYGDCMLIK